MKRTLAIILVVAMLFAFTACSKSEPVKTDEGTTQAGGFPVTVTDDAGREVTIEAEPQRIATTYATTLNFITALGAEDKMVGTNGVVTSPSLYEYVAPELMTLPSVGRGIPELETLASLDVDLFFGRGAQVEALGSVQDMGITAIGLAPESVEQVLATYDLIGAAVGKTERAAELKKAYADVIEKAEGLVANIPEDQRPTAIVMGSNIGSVANNAMLQSFLVQTAGGINPAADLNTTELWPTVGVEKIFEWDPEFIFVAGYGNYTAEQLYNDPAWANVSAVKNKKIFHIPSNLESWDMPTPTSALGVLWMLQHMYPEVYTDAELEADVKAYYDLHYPGNTITREILGY